MATVTRENIGTLHDKITVRLSREDYMPSFEKTLKQQAKSVSIPGFRKGMVPAGMVKKMFGQSIFTDEVLRTAGRELEDYLKNEKVAIFAQPMVMPISHPLDMNNAADVDFDFEIGLKPDFEIAALQNKPTLTKYQITISDAMLDDELKRVAQRFGTTEELEIVGGSEDLVSASYEVCDAEGNVLAEAQKAEGALPLEKYPAKLQELLKGKKVNDTVVFVPAKVSSGEELDAFLKSPLKQGDEAANNHYKLTITRIAQLIPHELNTELFLQVFPNEMITTESDFREKIKAELSREFDRITTDRLHNEIYEMLVHTTPIELPVPFLKRWLKDGGEKPKTEREVEAEFGSFDHQLRWTLVSDKLLIDNNIQVSREEVLDDIKTKVLAYFGLDNDEDAPWLDSYMQKVVKEEKTIDETYRRLLFAKLFAFLETQFNVETKEVSEEEFFKAPDAHAHHHHH